MGPRGRASFLSNEVIQQSFHKPAGIWETAKKNRQLGLTHKLQNSATKATLCIFVHWKEDMLRSQFFFKSPVDRLRNNRCSLSHLGVKSNQLHRKEQAGCKAVLGTVPPYRLKEKEHRGFDHAELRRLQQDAVAAPSGARLQKYFVFNTTFKSINSWNYCIFLPPRQL